MTLGELKALCKRYNIPDSADLVMWEQSGHFAGVLEPVGPIVFGSSPDGPATVQLWPLRPTDAQGAVSACP